MVLEGIEWFACLFGNVHQSLNDKESKSANRTVIVLTAFPTILLDLMNAGEEDDVPTAAEKAIKLLNLACTKICCDKVSVKRFNIISMIGPIDDPNVAEEIQLKWTTSRGGLPRTTRGRHLAAQYNLNFCVNYYMLLSVDEDKYTIIAVSADSKGTILVIFPKEKK